MDSRVSTTVQFVQDGARSSVLGLSGLADGFGLPKPATKRAVIPCRSAVIAVFDENFNRLGRYFSNLVKRRRLEIHCVLNTTLSILCHSRAVTSFARDEEKKRANGPHTTTGLLSCSSHNHGRSLSPAPLAVHATRLSSRTQARLLLQKRRERNNSTHQVQVQS